MCMILRLATQRNAACPAGNNIALSPCTVGTEQLNWLQHCTYVLLWRRQAEAVGLWIANASIYSTSDHHFIRIDSGDLEILFRVDYLIDRLFLDTHRMRARQSWPRSSANNHLWRSIVSGGLHDYVNASAGHLQGIANFLSCLFTEQWVG